MSTFFDGEYPVQPWQLNLSLIDRAGVYQFDYAELSWVKDGTVSFDKDWRAGAFADYATLETLWGLMASDYGMTGADATLGDDGTMPTKPTDVINSDGKIEWVFAVYSHCSAVNLFKGLNADPVSRWKEAFDSELNDTDLKTQHLFRFCCGWCAWTVGGLYQILVAQEARLLACIDNRGRKALGDGV